MQCKTYDYETGRDFDLTPLINKDGNYHALISEKLQQKSKLPPKVLVSNDPLITFRFWCSANINENHNCCHTWISIEFYSRCGFDSPNSISQRWDDRRQTTSTVGCCIRIQIDLMSPWTEVWTLNALQITMSKWLEWGECGAPVSHRPQFGCSVARLHT